MMRSVLAVAATAILLAWTGSELAAQPWYAGLPGDDVGSLAIQVGAVSPTTELPDGGGFQTGIAAGVTGTFWPFRHLGFRGSLLTGKTNGDRGPNNNSKAGLENPTLLLYNAEIAFRYPVVGGSLAWFPFVAAGGGGKTYYWSERLTGFPRDFTYAWTFAAGLEFRRTSSPWYGFVLEVKNFNSKYKWHGWHFDEPIMRDMIFTAGITLNR